MLRNIIIISTLLLLLSCRSIPINDSQYWQELQPSHELYNYQNIDGSIFSLFTGIECHLYPHVDSIYKWGYKPISNAMPFYVCVDNDWFQTTEKENDHYCTYAKDTNNVYFPLWLMATDCEDDRPIDIPCWSYFFVEIIKGVKPGSFRYLGHGYAVCGRKMYKNGKRIPFKKEIVNAFLLKCK